VNRYLALADKAFKGTKTTAAREAKRES